VGVTVRLDGSGSGPGRPSNQTPLLFFWLLKETPAGSAAKLESVSTARPSFVPDVAGTYTVRLIVNDGTADSAPQEAQVVAADDCHPSVTQLTATPGSVGVGVPIALSSTTVSPCDALSSGVGHDPVVKYRWSLAKQPPTSQASVLGADRVEASFVPDREGDYDVLLLVTDALGFSSQPADAGAHLKVSVVACGGNSPSLSAVTSTPSAPGVHQPVIFAATVSDADAQAPCGLHRDFSYAWRLESRPPNSESSLSDIHALRPGLTPDQPGTYVVSLVVTDQLGRSSQRLSGTVQVSTCGTALPIVTASAPSSVSTGQPVQLVAQSQDADTSAPCGLPVTYAYAWTLLTSPAGTHASLNDSTRQNPVLVPDVPGNYTAEVVVTASTGQVSAPAVVQVTAGACGSLQPMAAITAPATAVAGEPVSLSATVTDPNAACQTVTPDTFSWRLLMQPGGSNVALSGSAPGEDSTQVAPSFVPRIAGTYLVGLVATDATGHVSDPAVATIVVTTCSAPPTAVINAAVAGTGQPVTLSAMVTDPNAPGVGTTCTAAVLPYSYAWSIVDLPAGSSVALDNRGTASPSFVPDLAGAYGVRLVVTDAAGNQSAPATLSVPVTSCTAPLTVSIDPVTGTPATGVPVALTATVIDPNASGENGCTAAVTPLTYVWSLVSLPTGSVTTLNDPSAVSPGFVPDVEGSYTFALQVTDAAGTRSPVVLGEVVVAASCTGKPAVVIVAPGGNVTGQPVGLSATVTDPNAACATESPFQYAWRLVSVPVGSRARLTGAVGTDVTAQATPSFTPDVAGDYGVELAVTDLSGFTGTAQPVVVTAQGCNAPLTAAIVAPAGAATGSPVQISATASDPNTPGLGSLCTVAVAPYSYQWTLLSPPTGSSAQLNNPAAVAPTFVPDVSGQYTLQLVVTDAAGNLSPPVSASITVATCTAPLTATIQSVIGGATGVPVTFTANVNDPNLPTPGGCTAAVAPFAYAWTFAAVPTGSKAALNAPMAAGPSFVPDMPGAYVVALTVTDAAGNRSARSTASIAIANCTAPLTATINAVAGAAAGVPVSLTATVTDPNTPGGGNACTSAVGTRRTARGKRRGSGRRRWRRAHVHARLVRQLFGDAASHGRCRQCEPPGDHGHHGGFVLCSADCLGAVDGRHDSRPGAAVRHRRGSQSGNGLRGDRAVRLRVDASLLTARQQRRAEQPDGLGSDTDPGSSWQLRGFRDRDRRLGELQERVVHVHHQRLRLLVDGDVWRE
jgi:hypothetical protein